MAPKPAKSTHNYVQTPIPATRAAVYLRVSTDEQVEGYGLDAQRRRCLALAEAKGWTVVNELTDEGISGTKDEMQRPGLAELLALAHTGAIDAVIVLSLDRLARKTRLVLELVDSLAASGVAVVSVKEALDTTTPQGAFVLTMFAALAQLERDVIVQRTTDGRNERGKVDGERGGRVPLGYRRVGDGVVEVEAQPAQVVRRVFELRDDYGLTTRQIADRLNVEAVPTARAGRRWYASAVSIVLRNRTIYQGGTRADSPVTWPAILS